MAQKIPSRRGGNFGIVQEVVFHAEGVAILIGQSC